MASFQKVIKEYLDNFAKKDLSFAKKYDSNKIKDCCTYITSEARKEVENNCAVLTDAKVYSLAVHFFDEGLKVEASDMKAYDGVEVQASTETKKVQQKPKKAAKKAADTNQLSLFDL